MKDLKQYQGWAVITGASTGLGRAFAQQIAAQGVNCVLVALETDLLQDLAEDLRAQYGVECRTLTQDLTAPDFLERVLETIGDRPVGILVNNAGFACGGDFETRPADKLERIVLLNCLAPVLLTRALLPQMLERGRGAVIMVSSIAAIASAPRESVYSASKAFDLHFGEALWGEVQGRGIDVITVCPAGMQTRFFDRDGLSKEDIKKVMRFATSPEAIAALTLRRLGKQPTVLPPWTWTASVLGRLLPRRRAIQLTKQFMGRLFHYK